MHQFATFHEGWQTTARIGPTSATTSDGLQICPRISMPTKQPCQPAKPIIISRASRRPEEGRQYRYLLGKKLCGMCRCRTRYLPYLAASISATTQRVSSHLPGSGRRPILKKRVQEQRRTRWSSQLAFPRCTAAGCLAPRSPPAVMFASRKIPADPRNSYALYTAGFRVGR
jgi:hypothetical protein